MQTSRYSTLAPNQERQLGQPCAKCSDGHYQQAANTYGPTVKCDKCGHTVHRPRGKPFGAQSPVNGLGQTVEEGQQQQEQQGEQEQEEGQGQQQQQQEEQQEQQQEQQQQEEERHEQVKQLAADLKAELGTEYQHPLLKDVVYRIAVAGFRNVALVGPAGSGKTTMARQVWRVLKRHWQRNGDFTFALGAMSGGRTEGYLWGMPDAMGGYKPGLMVPSFETGGLCLLDDCDRADANVLASLHGPIENGYVAIPQRHGHGAVELQRHGQSVVLASFNTISGPTMAYNSAQQLDLAFLRRFAGATFSVDYDTQLEQKVARGALPRAKADDLCARFWATRKRVREHNLLKVWGTGELVAAAKLVRGGYPLSAVWGILTETWRDDERQKAQAGAL